jgi:flagellar biosynthesis anti-sigma factor FlgM|tara:strand:+ start:706 stop:1014 length:309 start_codon:yes stop_codon:yes gene_type:complete
MPLEVIIMTDPISNLGRTATQLSASNEKNQKMAAPKVSDDGIQKSPNNDELILSKATESSLAKAEFDADKVARIKAAIREGNYPVDAAKVAESFIALERMID